MISRMKTLLLVFLVAASLLQTYFLVFSMPKFDSINLSQYVQPDFTGTPETLEELIFPEQIVLHYGKERHTVLYPRQTAFYDMIFDFVRQRSFDGFKRIGTTMLNMNWQEIRNKQPGVEIRFRAGVPVQVLQNVMNLKGDLLNETALITRIWFYERENSEEVKAFFFTDNPLIVYEATKPDLNNKDLERFIGLGENLPNYTLRETDIYIPEKPLDIVKLTIPYDRLTPTQLQNLLFVDPANIRNFKDREGSEIYTDGKRGLQVRSEKLWFTYSDPAPPVEQRSDIQENLLSAVQFINQHGGWNGTYAIGRLPSGISVGKQTLMLRQFMESYPIIGAEEDSVGLIRIHIQKGLVTSYERSMTVMDVRRMERTQQSIPGGQDLEARLALLAEKGSVAGVYPAYRPQVREKFIELIPAWAVEYRDGTISLLK
ncbi:YycH family regulatory protein [Paenibacillus sp. y28]|uniref:YycH family regulatory protein n=1 Tax=Paenibacillus sp. y28 TaxID=3129110 RepID=UPI0030193F68